MTISRPGYQGCPIDFLNSAGAEPQDQLLRPTWLPAGTLPRIPAFALRRPLK